MDEPSVPPENGPLGTTLSAGALGIASVFAIAAWASVLGAITGVDPRAATSAAILVSTLASGLGTVSVAALYLASEDAGVGYLDLSTPSLRGAVYVIGGTLLLVGLNVGITWVLDLLEVETASHAILDRARSNPEILLVMIPLSYLVIGPGEELLFRNVVQKSLYDSFSRAGAVVVASAIFAVVHVFSYLEPGSVLATLGGLATVFGLSLVLGALYARTENLLVPVLVHASFDAVAFASAYLHLT